MAQAQFQSPKRARNTLCAAFTMILALSLPIAARQGQPTLRITSPTSGFLVNPGQVVPVSVSSPTPSAFTRIIIVGQGALGLSDIATALPAQFSITVPANTAPGKYNLVASGIITSGAQVDSAPIFIDVERADLPTKMSEMVGRLIFRTQGERLPLQFWGNFADGSYLYVNRSSYMTFSSSNVSVVTVDALGMATAIAAGNASITATYTLGLQNVQVNVPVTVDPPLLTSSPASLTFGNQAIGTTSATQTLTLTNVSNHPIGVLQLGILGSFTETDNCVSSSPLPIGGTCTINVKFAPVTAGQTTATVDITNDFTSVQISIPLSGTGICHYVFFNASPSSVPPGGATTLTGTLMSCASTAQTITVQFTLTAPAQGNCGATNSLMFTSPPFTLQPNTSQSFSFSAQIPSGICAGPYTVVATTLVNGQAVDTSSATLTVTP
jgi:hypothetical protein